MCDGFLGKSGLGPESRGCNVGCAGADPSFHFCAWFPGDDRGI